MQTARTNAGNVLWYCMYVCIAFNQQKQNRHRTFLHTAQHCCPLIPHTHRAVRAVTRPVMPIKCKSLRALKSKLSVIRDGPLSSNEILGLQPCGPPKHKFEKLRSWA